jgi:hypothetical protein
MLGINLAFMRSSLCLVCFSFAGRDGLARAVDGEVDSPLVDDACRLVDNPLSDMTLSVIKSRSTYVTNSSTAVSSSVIRTRD